MAGTLYLVPTPIGNLGDISQRMAKTLAEADFIAAEDTRVTVKLLNHLGIKKPMVIYHRHNTGWGGQAVLDRLLAGENCALVTDAGTPAISDPGEELVAKKESDGGVSYNLSSLSVKGSPLSTRYDSLLSARTYLDSLYALNARKFAAFDSLMMAAYKSKDQAKIKELRQSADGKARAEADKVFFGTVDSLYHQVVMANKDSFWGPLMMISFTAI